MGLDGTTRDFILAEQYTGSTLNYLSVHRLSTNDSKFETHCTE